jgi:hypothetical protein
VLPGRANRFNVITSVDPVCIDKDSSAELSEAINSMYTWYQKARICYAYLSDVQADCSKDLNLVAEELAQPDHEYSTQTTQFASSRWFSRGWTLQELLAPEILHFYSDSWTLLGTRESLHRLVSVITGIDTAILLNPVHIHDPFVSVAKKMSWAAHRNTTRLEDRAYSLLGIFNVNMPLLYGEGRKAFTRLQEEILRTSDDESIFAWDYNWMASEPGRLLAQSPAEFRDGARIVRWFDGGIGNHGSYHMTNKGLRIRLPILGNTLSRISGASNCIAILACRYEDDFRGPVGLHLVQHNDKSDVYDTIDSSGSRLCVIDLAEANIYNISRSSVIPKFSRLRAPGQETLEMIKSTVHTTSKCWVRILDPWFMDLQSLEVVPSQHWNREARTLWIPLCRQAQAAFSFTCDTGQWLAVAFGTSTFIDGKPWIDIGAFDPTRDHLEHIFDGPRPHSSASAEMKLNSAPNRTVVATIKQEVVMNERIHVVDVFIWSSHKAKIEID